MAVMIALYTGYGLPEFKKIGDLGALSASLGAD